MFYVLKRLRDVIDRFSNVCADVARNGRRVDATAVRVDGPQRAHGDLQVGAEEQHLDEPSAARGGDLEGAPGRGAPGAGLLSGDGDRPEALQSRHSVQVPPLRQRCASLNRSKQI
eukprot:8728486-Pyramimonas_sp.AAC.1